MLCLSFSGSVVVVVIRLVVLTSDIRGDLDGLAAKAQGRIQLPGFLTDGECV